MPYSTYTEFHGYSVCPKEVRVGSLQVIQHLYSVLEWVIESCKYQLSCSYVSPSLIDFSGYNFCQSIFSNNFLDHCIVYSGTWYWFVLG